MATEKKTTTPKEAPETTSEEQTQQSILAAAQLILDQEQKRKEHRERRARRKQQAASIQMMRSIEVIKWCVVAISTAICLTFIVGVVVLYQVKSEVADIKGEAEQIRERLRHPLETVGGSIGRRMESRIGDMIGGDDE